MTSDEFTIQETFVDVGDDHQLYVQDWGNKDARTLFMFLHGGPGTGASNRYRNYFNPYEQRVIFFDQRGAGRSVPHGSLDHNTTPDLVEDIEKIAKHLGVERFILTGTGGSWGTCLALAYALKYPDRVTSLVLRGIFTASKLEIDFWTKGAFKTFFPDAWDHYLSQTPKAYHNDPTRYHYNRILGDDPVAMKESAYIYSMLEGSLAHLDDRYMVPDVEDFDPTGTRIEAHYLANNCFIPNRYIMDNAHKLIMPTWIVQGRFDLICPPSTAYELNNRISGSTLLWTMAGHHGNDRSNYDVVRTILAHWS
ncbi:MAG TPA: alpha/beta fold hydrolase [Candidatus Saccharimonadales bacterium]|nr:alpha/beta fold hydrolase [Candidatus Saccharimonadales bacterium]